MHQLTAPCMLPAPAEDLNYFRENRGIAIRNHSAIMLGRTVNPFAPDFLEPSKLPPGAVYLEGWKLKEQMSSVRLRTALAERVQQREKHMHETQTFHQ